MHRSIIIIDNFLNDPDHFRSMGRKMDFPSLKEISNFPGRNSLQRLTAPDIDQTVSNIVGENLVPLTDQSHAKFRLTLKADIGKAAVHLDNSQWSGILYLSNVDNEESGTDFFRHKDTGLDSTLLSDEEMRRQGWGSIDVANKEINNILESDTNNPDAWDFLMRVPMKYNRLLLLRPWLWHTAGPGFGDCYDNGRLVYLLFYASKK